MEKLLKPVFGILLIVLFVTPVTTQAGKPPTLVWSDEFSGPNIDPNIWDYDVGGEGWWNNQLEYSTDGLNSYIEDGCLVIEAKEESYGECWYGDCVFTSSRMKTKDLFWFEYGTLEARVKVPDLADGLWPAIWTLGQTELDWPDCGELDVLEMGGGAAIAEGKVNRRCWAAAHWEYMCAYAGYGLTIDADSDLYQDFHIWKLEWTPNMITVSLDNTEFWWFDIDPYATEEHSLEEYHRPHHLMVGVAVGGFFPEITDPNLITAPFPAKMYVDYIRLYDAGDTTIKGSYCGDETCDDDEDKCDCPGDCGAPPSTETNCTDEIDEDCDCAVDCDDTDCAEDPACTCLESGQPCESDPECCSGRCRGGYCR